MDFPTPPLPEAMATIDFTPGTCIGPACGLGCPPIFKLGAGFAGAAPWAVKMTDTVSMPGRSATAASAARRGGSSPAACSGDGASITKRTAAPSTVSARTISRDTRSPPSGNATADSAPIILSLISAIGVSLILTSLLGDFRGRRKGLIHKPIENENQGQLFWHQTTPLCPHEERTSQLPGSSDPS